MKKLVKVFICAYSVLFFFFTPVDSMAAFVNNRSIDTSIKLRAGYLSLDVMAQQDVLSFSDKDKTQDVRLNVKNTGTLEGKVTFAIQMITLDGQNLTVDQAKEYIELADLGNIEKIKAGESQTATLTLRRKKPWSDKTPIKITIQTTISQGNLVNDTTGFIDKKETTIQLTSKDTKGDWIDEGRFNQYGYAIGQQMYYSVVNDQLTTVVPGIVYIKYKSGQTISKSENQEISDLIKNAIKPVQGMSYKIDSILYVENQGFKIQLSLESKSAQMNFVVNGIQFQYINSNLVYAHISDFCKPLILDADINRSNRFTNQVLYSSMLGTNYHLFSNKETNTFNSGLTAADILDYLQVHYDIGFAGTDAHEFRVSFPENNVLNIKQLDTSGGKKANLVMREKGTQKVVFSREVYSVTQTDLSSIDLSDLTSDFQTKVDDSKVEKRGNAFYITTDFYMKIPTNFLGYYYLQPFNQPLMKNFTLSYSIEMDYLNISFEYSYPSEPDTIEQMIVFLGYHFGSGFTTSEQNYTLYKRLNRQQSVMDQSNKSVEVHPSSESNNFPSLDKIATTAESQPSSTNQNDPDDGVDSTEETIEFSTIESNNTVSSQSESSQEPK